MSLKSVQKFEDKNKRRDSYEERVCDDLSEVLLQYLSLEERFRLESVSKQFQRTVFEKQLNLVADRFLKDFQRRQRLRL